jgi:ribosomal protein L7/L12
MTESPPKFSLSAKADAAVRAGNLLKAIGVVRQEAGLDWKDAKDLLDAHLLERDSAAQAPAAHRLISAEAEPALRQGNRIEAIKIVRLERHLKLKEARDAVDAYIKTQSDLIAIFKHEARPRRMILAGLLVVVAVAAPLLSLGAFLIWTS